MMMIIIIIPLTIIIISIWLSAGLPYVLHSQPLWVTGAWWPSLLVGLPLNLNTDRVLHFDSETSQFRDISLVSDSVLKNLVSNYDHLCWQACHWIHEPEHGIIVGVKANAPYGDMWLEYLVLYDKDDLDTLQMAGRCWQSTWKSSVIPTIIIIIIIIVIIIVINIIWRIPTTSLGGGSNYALWVGLLQLGRK